MLFLPDPLALSCAISDVVHWPARCSASEDDPETNEYIINTFWIPKISIACPQWTHVANYLTHAGQPVQIYFRHNFVDPKHGNGHAPIHLQYYTN